MKIIRIGSYFIYIRAKPNDILSPLIRAKLYINITLFDREKHKKIFKSKNEGYSNFQQYIYTNFSSPQLKQKQFPRIEQW